MIFLRCLCLITGTVCVCVCVCVSGLSESARQHWCPESFCNSVNISSKNCPDNPKSLVFYAHLPESFCMHFWLLGSLTTAFGSWLLTSNDIKSVGNLCQKSYVQAELRRSEARRQDKNPKFIQQLSINLESVAWRLAMMVRMMWGWCEDVMMMKVMLATMTERVSGSAPLDHQSL